MSLGVSASLQAAIFDRLTGDAELAGLVNGQIHDAPPTGDIAPDHVLIGAGDIQARSDQAGHLLRHDLVISVVARRGGFLRAKQAAGRITALLTDADLPLAEGRLVGLQFRRARARARGADRRIDLIFRALTDDS